MRFVASRFVAGANFNRAAAMAAQTSAAPLHYSRQNQQTVAPGGTERAQSADPDSSPAEREELPTELGVGDQGAARLCQSAFGFGNATR
jgi:hypothetical protein